MTIPVQSGKINISSWAFGLGSFCFLFFFVLRCVFFFGGICLLVCSLFFFVLGLVLVMLELTDLDKKLLNLLQGKLQLVSRPFKLIGEEVGMSEEQVITRLQLLKEAGYIRKIGAFFNSDELGYRGTLVALKVREGLMEETALFINQFPGITHNYQREGEYNLWFTLITPNERLRQDILGQIGALPGVEAVMDLSARKKYKINVQFRLK